MLLLQQQLLLLLLLQRHRHRHHNTTTHKPPHDNPHNPQPPPHHTTNTSSTTGKKKRRLKETHNTELPTKTTTTTTTTTVTATATATTTATQKKIQPHKKTLRTQTTTIARYHIFYFLLKGATPAERQRFKLTAPIESFRGVFKGQTKDVPCDLDELQDATGKQVWADLDDKRMNAPVDPKTVSACVRAWRGGLA